MSGKNNPGTGTPVPGGTVSRENYPGGGERSGRYPAKAESMEPNKNDSFFIYGSARSPALQADGSGRTQTPPMLPIYATHLYYTLPCYTTPPLLRLCVRLRAPTAESAQFGENWILAQLCFRLRRRECGESAERVQMPYGRLRESREKF